MTGYTRADGVAPRQRSEGSHTAETEALVSDQPVSSRLNAELDVLLRESIRHSGIEGRPLHLTPTPFTASAAGAIAGLMGLPAWAARLKRIHDGRIALVAQLDAAWADYAHRYRTRPQLFARHWTDYLRRFNLTPLNDLIRKHNDYYVIEARIPVQWPSGKYLLPDGIEWPQPLYTADHLLHAYPADLDMALYFSTKPKTE